MPTQICIQANSKLCSNDWNMDERFSIKTMLLESMWMEVDETSNQNRELMKNVSNGYGYTVYTSSKTSDYTNLLNLLLWLPWPLKKKTKLKKY